RDSASVVGQLGQIEMASGHAVQEVQTMVYTLRDLDGSTEPLLDISQLRELVRQANSTLLILLLEHTGDSAGLSAATELTVYRRAQEALSSARKHAGEDVTVRVELHYGPTDVTLSVTDDGKEYAPVTNGTGTGVQGMQERVNAVHGTLEYGPRTPYGWKVLVRVPCAISNEGS